jgi:hypothetical protein
MAVGVWWSKEKDRGFAALNDKKHVSSIKGNVAKCPYVKFPDV